MDREVMDRLTYMWAQAYMEITRISFSLIATTAMVVGDAMHDPDLIDEIESHLRRVAS